MTPAFPIQTQQRRLGHAKVLAASVRERLTTPPRTSVRQAYRRTESVGNLATSARSAARVDQSQKELVFQVISRVPRAN
jgi:hypothetical protein